MQKRTLALCLLAALSSSCATTGPGSKPAAAAPCEPQIVTKTRIVDTACDWTRPIYVSRTDVISDDTARAILAHNQAGAKVCGWKPAGK
ncbi:hypothetical protein WM11_21515 [Burkholderia ubonensis]|uniref:hypothetical protein n=1 Tax=Burkholderia ubonensis TaxID=101571 RepID=UPI000752737C|nr:hypothetical protein [Burkholderia ubonensis]KWI89547.1 hypothetical protein WM10_17420 [Burkholderia ubonensis]KWI99193.1 hypothetical protein WM11_21515 [Burkholderia ubonensis]KWK03239.1 hypothetical protein WM12_27795 [Burkholderia ubonensis]KWK44204.1 hypothetical protein WM14_11635 [Burkholderia ubonensis]KWK46270.1 hypothetical protein WM13_06205 [Burkholderia ubonensis]